ncbi:hypothetical protein CVT24_009391 [Panaeolus cyanescens]|uniref:Zn(2)-C6 fungal-type domain-containing protein n=1 Tax=Panaeolus cyanescens TaxID=181874 RepID=A0A409VER9_9AGAR|nr:hypothetical protein CVT24_009391 [Panaeolus cyanescens]
MSPRGTSSTTSTHATRNSTAPYTRRSSSQPKSSRQQFSACGACRMRRVRCDLKDLPIGTVGPHPACTNCQERGIKCIDEFADVKAVKLLRRGRRLQQVEAIYGKVTDSDGLTAGLSSRLSISIPTLHTDFFASPFWRWFIIQRPILDAVEFPARWIAHTKGNQPLGNEGGLIAMLLVVWAASFGLDERGQPQVDEGAEQSPDSGSKSDGSPYPGEHSKYNLCVKRQKWKSTTDGYLREILELIDLNGVLRRPTFDGVRALLLLLPLMEEAQPLERLAIHEATMSQVQALCVLSASSSNLDDALTRARLFWYAYTQEGMMTGSRGGRFVLTADDLDTFQRTLPPLHSGSTNSGLQSPSPPLDQQHESSLRLRESPAYKAYLQLVHSSAIPLELSNICRKIHAVLTGIKATRRAEEHGLIDAHGMRDIWRDLDRCWQDLESMKRSSNERDDASRRMEVEQYASLWQIFIFDCHNAIRESLKHCITNATSAAMYAGGSPSRPSSSHSSNSSPYLSPQYLHITSTRKCQALLPSFIRTVRSLLPIDHGVAPSIFRWDAGLVRDGCFFAGYLAASMDGEFLETLEEAPKGGHLDFRLTLDDSISICLTTLSAMRWAFSKSEEREETVRLIWANRKMRRQEQGQAYDSDYSQSVVTSQPQLHLSLSQHSQAVSLSDDRPMLPPLDPFTNQRRVQSAPNTANSTDGRGMNGWPSYTPPSTATSIATSTGTALSGRGSPIFSNMPSFKASSDEIFYHGNGADLDNFSYSAPIVRESPDIAANYERHSTMEPHGINATSSYLAPIW